MSGVQDADTVGHPHLPQLRRAGTVHDSLSATHLTRFIVATVTRESVSHLSALFPLEDGKGLSPVTKNNDQLYLKRQIRLDPRGSLIQ